MTDEENRFQAAIRETLAAHPDWLGSVLSAVTAGMHRAIEAERQRAGLADAAMRSSLALSDPSRLTAETKAMLGKSICDHLTSYNNHCAAERKALERFS